MDECVSADDSRRHLLIFIYSMGDGGAERVAANLANHWAAQGWTISLVSLAPISTDLFELHPAVNRLSLELADSSSNLLVGLYQNIRRTRALRAVLRRLRPEIALAKMTTANVLLAFASWGLPGLVTIGAEHTYPGRNSLNRVWRMLRKHSFGLLDAVVVLTGEGEQWIKHNTRAHKVLAIPNAVTWPLSGREPRIIPDPRYQAGRKLLLAVGRLVEVKGFDLLIKAFSSVASHHAAWDLVILGDGPLRGALEVQISQLGLDGRISLPGWAGNIPEWYEHADLYVMSSRFEGFPMTLAEAMAYSLPAVSFDCDTGPRDIIRHGVDGLLVRSGDTTELADALDKLMRDDLLRAQFSHRAIEVRDRFSMLTVTRMWEQLFQELWPTRH